MLTRSKKPSGGPIVAALVVALSTAAFAADPSPPARVVQSSGADDAIVTDRPDVAESSQTVGKWRLQIELGLDVETRKQPGSAQATDFRTPLKLRFGLLEWVELHLETDGIGYSHTESGDGGVDEAGVADLDLGGKVHLVDQRGVVPSTGLLLALTLPIGVQEIAPGQAFLLSPTIAADWDLPGKFSLALNLGSTVVLSDRDAHSDVLRYALSVGRSWAPLTDSLGSYLELYGETPLDGGSTALAVDGGFTLQVRARTQLDFMLRVGLTDEAPEVGGGVGFSFKI